jgi:hypothetical protein
MECMNEAQAHEKAVEIPEVLLPSESVIQAYNVLSSIIRMHRVSFVNVSKHASMLVVEVSSLDATVSRLCSRVSLNRQHSDN